MDLFADAVDEWAACIKELYVICYYILLIEKGSGFRRMFRIQPTTCWVTLMVPVKPEQKTVATKSPIL